MKNSAMDNTGLLMGNEYREAGEMDGENGKKIKWDAGYKVSMIPLRSTTGRVVKYTVAEPNVGKIDGKLADVNWGSVIKLTLRGKIVEDVEVLYDYLDEVPFDM